MPQFLSQSRPYARSCLEVATAANKQAEWAAALDALAAVCSAPEIAQFLDRPGIGSAQLAQAVLDAAAELCPLPERVDNLVKLLFDNRRLALLPDIAESYRRLWRQQSQRVSVRIESAFELDADQLKSLDKALRQRLGVEPEIEVSLAPQLGAGAVLRIGDDVIDASLRTRLNNFASSLAYD